MGKQSVNITYETLFDIFRNEKKEGLQLMPEGFYADLVAYLKEKTQSDADQEALAKQLKNIHKLVRDIYEMRETKIVNLTLVSVRGSDVDTAGLLPQEQRLFDSIVSLLKEARKEVLAHLLRGELPGSSQPAGPKAEAPESGEKPAAPLGLTMLVRFLAHVPKFVGTELEVYGPFEPGDMANLPTEIAEVLIAKSRASALS